MLARAETSSDSETIHLLSAFPSTKRPDLNSRLMDSGWPSNASRSLQSIASLLPSSCSLWRENANHPRAGKRLRLGVLAFRAFEFIQDSADLGLLLFCQVFDTDRSQFAL